MPYSIGQTTLLSRPLLGQVKVPSSSLRIHLSISRTAYCNEKASSTFRDNHGQTSTPLMNGVYDWEKKMPSPITLRFGKPNSNALGVENILGMKNFRLMNQASSGIQEIHVCPRKGLVYWVPTTRSALDLPLKTMDWGHKDQFRQKNQKSTHLRSNPQHKFTPPLTECSHSHTLKSWKITTRFSCLYLPSFSIQLFNWSRSSPML